MREGFTFEHERVEKGLDFSSLEAYFDGLPRDHYIEGHYRRRRLSRFRGPVERLQHLPHGHFIQSGLYNQMLGNIQRDYEELEEALIASTPFKALIGRVHQRFEVNPETTVLGVHQIRISCTLGEEGEPAPEGIHQDGFDFITVACVNRHHIEGAATELYEDPKAEPVFSRECSAGEILYCNDRSLYHYTTPIHPSGDVVGHRDVFVVTVRCGVGEQDS